jgi:ATP-binding cassette subfamily F protein 3
MKLSLSHIKKSFGAQDVLVDASIQIKNKEKVAIVGKNGCGKSTLLKIIDGSLPADSGNRIVSNQVKIGVIDQIIFKDLNTFGEILDIKSFKWYNICV